MTTRRAWRGSVWPGRHALTSAFAGSFERIDANCAPDESGVGSRDRGGGPDLVRCQRIERVRSRRHGRQHARPGRERTTSVRWTNRMHRQVLLLRPAAVAGAEADAAPAARPPRAGVPQKIARRDWCRRDVDRAIFVQIGRLGSSNPRPTGCESARARTARRLRPSDRGSF